jgi:hypothetical protein
VSVLRDSCGYSVGKESDSLCGVGYIVGTCGYSVGNESDSLCGVGYIVGTCGYSVGKESLIASVV